MVVFTCNHCGDSLKKNTVEKHYNTKCRGGQIFITCMDCLKDFNKNYEEHTKCVSEIERYSSKDFVSKPGQNKGEKKQKLWCDLVHSIIEQKAASLDPHIRIILNKLLNFDNVPRKQAKFKNFLSNSLRVHPNQAEVIWKLLDEEIQREAKTEQPATTIIPEKTNLHLEPPSKRVKLSNVSLVTNGENNHEENGTNNGDAEGKFSWKDAILKVLKKKNQISQEKLRIKVINKYLKCSGESEITAKMMKKFGKKLKKIENIVIEDGKVMLNGT